MSGHRARLQALERVYPPVGQGLRPGPYGDKPQPDAAWWAAFEALFIELNDPDQYEAMLRRCSLGEATPESDD